MRFAGSTIEQAIAAETDIFGRDHFAAGLLNLFESSDDPLVVALDEKWGTGKTVFARRLEKQATDKGFTVVYFDAFKRDYDPDVFIALSAELLAKIPQTSSNRSSLKENAKAVGKTIGKLALKGSVRILTAGVLKEGDFSEANKEVADELSNIAEAELDALIDRRLDNARLADQTFEKFKISLKELADTTIHDGAEEKPLLFIVDELDRCRPDYALSVLETIKHFFSVPNVHFLLVCDTEQLVAAVRNRYGIEAHGHTYLEKFIDVKASFPVQKKHNRESSIRMFCENFTAEMKKNEEQTTNWRDIQDTIIEISIYKNYTLRRIEKILTQFAVCMNFLNLKSNIYDPIFYILCDLKITNPILFEKAKNGTLSYAEIRDFYDLGKNNGAWYIPYLRYVFDAGIDHTEAMWTKIGNELRYRSDDNAASLGMHVANNIVDKIG